MTVISEGGATTEWTQRDQPWVLEVGLWDDEALWDDLQAWQDLPTWTVIHTGDRTDGV